jgi:predicted NACHT family NTPase
MRPPTKGRVLKERVWCFVEALLTRAEDSFDFEVHWEDENTDRPKFVVKTRRRFLEAVAELKQSQIYEVINSLKGLELLEDRRFKQKRGSDQWCFALKLWSRDAQRNREQFERIWEGSRTEKSKALEATYNKSKDSAEVSQDEIDWQDVCLAMLEKQKQLTTNRLMHPEEMVFDINQIHVPLALVERKQPDKRSGDDNPEQSQLYKPDYEETQKLEYEEFLATVLKASPSNKIAIIGEPGAGKTTLLQRIAFWILDKTDGLPIWIRLGNLPTPAPKLKDYLLHNWLEDTILNVTPKIKAEFEELLTAGRVWLLLDGVDEMVANSGNLLSFIDSWIPGWCQQLSVVLTCRLNVWEANPHALNNFQTYRTLEFSPEKVIEFIEACFQESNPALGIQLQQALNQPGKERIKDLIRNPLRLTLLCSTWHLREGKLPDTKAELYQQYVEEVYRWKEDEFPTTPEQRKQLNAKLKELALAAIDKEENRFCLRHKFVEGVLGERDGCVFQLALNIGWLNRVGVDAKNPNPNQPVYAFFHPTFQEYFAALAIADWDFFLPRAHDNHNPQPVSERYRIFEPQWKEVILLWLGREEVEKEQKEKFIKVLVEFEEGCKDFYKCQAFFLAAVGIAEFSNCSFADAIVAQIVEYGFGYFNRKKRSGVDFLLRLQRGQ